MGDMTDIVTYFDVTAKVFTRIHFDGEYAIIQIYESELDDMAEVRMVEFVGLRTEVASALDNIARHLLDE